MLFATMTSILWSSGEEMTLLSSGFLVELTNKVPTSGCDRRWIEQLVGLDKSILGEEAKELLPIIIAKWPQKVHHRFGKHYHNLVLCYSP